eukprot:EG_transcript_29976
MAEAEYPRRGAAVVVKQLLSVVHGLFGDFGVGAVRQQIAVAQPMDRHGRFALRVPRRFHAIVRAGLAFITELENRPCIIRCLRVSGRWKEAQAPSAELDRDIVADPLGHGSHTSHT